MLVEPSPWRWARQGVVKVRRIASIIVLILAGSLWLAVPGFASGSTVAQSTPAARLQADFNNDGADDLAVGVPEESVAGHIAAGVVEVLPGSTTGVTGTGSQLFTQVGGAVESVDFFGAALAAGDFNNDGFTDLAGLFAMKRGRCVTDGDVEPPEQHLGPRKLADA